MLVTIFALSLFALGSLAGALFNSTGCLCTYEEALLANRRPVVQGWTDGNWRSSLPGAMEEPNFESFVYKNGTISACYLNTSLGVPCEQGSVPVIGVDARTPQDSTGCLHDYLGRSAGRGSFVVWTHKMKNITYDSKFTPQGAPANETYQALTVDAGVQWHEAYDAANQNGRMMVGAVGPDGSIGAAGGWLQGGGHSSLSPTYGLGVDNAVQVTVVTSTGDHLTVNNYQYPDLFWALRGGGGSTYGIVTSVTYRTYQQLPVVAYSMQANVTNATVMQELIGGMLRLLPNLADDGWAGYGWLQNTSVTFISVNPSISIAAANTSMQALTNYLLSLESNGVSLAVAITPFDTWYAWFAWFGQLLGTTSGEGANMMITSRLLSRDTLVNQYADVAEVLYDCQAGLNMVGGGKVSQIDPDSVGLNPAWRNAIVETVCGVSWADGTTAAEIAGQIDRLKVWIKEMYALTPQAGAYFNEASLFEIDWQYTFFGSHYARLKEIKDKYDPYRLFVVAEGVGSDEWNEELICRWW
ncbi:hypothetical protein EDC04DRAFT_2613108 [Pisolithus marmoratus]|nr:hypothetical protein EDC04DRAFT_2613108 [Pisolithus marmoratus]